MQVTVASADGGHVAQIAVEPQQSVGSVAAQLEQQFGIPAALQVLVLNGNPVRSTLTFEQAGIKDDDLLVIVRNPSATATSTPAASSGPSSFTARSGMRLHEIPPNASAEVLLDIMDKNPQLLPQLQQGNPQLAQALQTKNVAEVRKVLLKMYMDAASRSFKEQQEMMELDQNPFDPNAQARIEERIRLANVQENMEMALEEMPESFARVTMLYIPCEVNGRKVKAFVDSGAQSTIMSSNCAERCGIMRLVDKRMAGQAVGVGTAKIIGRVHLAALKIGDVFYNCSFTILDQQNVDFLFGLDMLKRHQCCIDLQKNVLRLTDHSESHEVPFLPEHEIPMSERGEDPGQQQADEIPAPPAPSATANPTSPAPPAPTAGAASTGGDSLRDKVARLVALGFDEQMALEALQTTGENVELAAGLLFEGMM